MNSILVILAIITLGIYTVSIIRKGGIVPSSLSASVFILPYGRRWIWSAVIFAVCFLCISPYVTKTGEQTQFLAFLSIAGLLFVGGAPLVRSWQDNLQFQVHQWGAILCAACSQLVLVFNCPYLLLCWTPFVAYEAWRFINYLKWRTEVFWGEMVCFASTFIYCLI